jgi:hypothetical protein
VERKAATPTRTISERAAFKLEEIAQHSHCRTPTLNSKCHFASLPWLVTFQVSAVLADVYNDQVSTLGWVVPFENDAFLIDVHLGRLLL